jgi:apolipoprotein N-acyltransferase
MVNFTEKLKGLKVSSSVLCFLAGVVYALPYYFKYLFVLSFISLIVLFTILLENRKRFFRCFYSFSFGFYLALYFWLSRLYPFAGFDFTKAQGIVIIILACVGIPLYHALLHTAVMSLTKLLPDNDYLLTAGYGAAWILSEWVMSLGKLGFPWGRAALSQVGLLYSVQTVSLFGSYFIVIVLVCSCMMLTLALKKRKRMYSYIGCSIILVNLIAGTVLYYIPVNTPAENEKSIKVGILQGNAASNEKWDIGKTQEILDRYISMAYQAADNGAKVIVLPESAIPLSFSENSLLYRKFAEIAKEYDLTVLAGVLIDKREYSYNSVVAVYPDGRISKPYVKRHIVPFGEYIPYQSFLEKAIPFIKGLNLGGLNSTAGDESVVIDIDGIKNGSLVCFDSIFDDLARDNVTCGAEIITVVTNDSWFKDSAGITQHLNHSVLRAIENRRSIIRAANTGISAFISPKGDVIKQTEPLVADIIYSDVYAVDSKTLYSSTGNIVLYLAMLFEVIIIISSKYRKVRKKNAENSEAI